MLTLLRFFIYLFFNEYLSRMEHLILGDPGAVSQCGRAPRDIALPELPVLKSTHSP